MSGSPGAGSGASPEIYRIAGIAVDPVRATITRAGRPVALRPKCYDLLLHLLRNPNRVVSKRELIGEVWNGATVSNDTIAGCISEIRALLGEGGGSELIRTIRGRGYLLELEGSPEPPHFVKRGRFRRWSVFAALAAAVLLAAAWMGWRWMPRSVPAGESGWWRFDEASGDGVLDASGHSNHGKLAGGVKRVRTPSGPALEFDGLSGSVEGLGPGNGFPSGGSSRTVTCRIRLSAPPAEDVGLFHFGGPQRDRPASNFHLFIDREGKVGFGNGYNWSVCRSLRSIADGEWHFVTASYNEPQAMCDIGIDGALDNAQILSMPPATMLEAPWTMGIFMGGGIPYRGFLADVRLFSYYLSGTHKTAIWHCGTPELGIPFEGEAPAFLLPLSGAVKLGKPDSGETGPFATAYSPGFASIELARSGGRCALADMSGMNLPRFVRIRARVRIPAGDSGVALGPYFSERPGRLGEQAGNERRPGLWVAATGAGALEVRRLPHQPGDAPVSRWETPGISAGTEHNLTADVCGDTLRFSLGGHRSSVPLPANPQRAAGFAFWLPSKPRFTQLARIGGIRVERLAERDCANASF